MALLEQLKMLCNENTNFTDAILDFQLEAAGNDILNYCHIESIPKELEHVQLELALKRLNRMGQEGSLSYSEGGMSGSFDEYLTENIKAQLRKFRKVVF